MTNDNTIAPQKEGIKILSIALGRVGTTSLAVLAFILGVLTFVFLRLQLHEPGLVSWLSALLYIDIAVLILLSLVIGLKISVNLRKRVYRKGGLHVLLSSTLGFLVVVPSFILLAFTLLVFEFGLSNWFSRGVQQAVTSAAGVAEAYLEENRKRISADALAFVRFIDYTFANQSTDRESLGRWLSFQMIQHGIHDAAIISSPDTVLALSGNVSAEEVVAKIQPYLAEADTGSVVIFDIEKDDNIETAPVRALVRLRSVDSVYLFISRLLDKNAIIAVNQTQDAATIYRNQASIRGQLQISYTMVFALLSLLLALVSITFGLAFSDRIARPLERLAKGARRVQKGELGFKLISKEKIEEVKELTDAFNSMSSRLLRQRENLDQERKERDARLSFIESLLTNTSSGVMALDDEGYIILVNLAAVSILGGKLKQFNDTSKLHILQAVPALKTIFDDMEKGSIANNNLNQQITIVKKEKEIVLNVRLTKLGYPIYFNNKGKQNLKKGYMITFDDITEPLRAEGEAIWSDVAQRLAHEIKNPLTPIQLSAERLRDRYLNNLPEEQMQLEARNLLESVLRHVGNIGQMVGEFSSFAKMPATKFNKVDLCRLCWQSLLLESGRERITFIRDFPDNPVWINCDPRQISQVLVNLLENAVAGIKERMDNEKNFLGKIKMEIKQKAKEVSVIITDNGAGTTKEILDRAFLPGVGSKSRGSGLGLAIVNSIVKDHKGNVSLAFKKRGKGIIAKFSLPLPAKDKKQSDEGDNTQFTYNFTEAELSRTLKY